MSGPLNRLIAKDELIYVSTTTGRVICADVTFPSTPRVLSTYMSSEIFYGMALDEYRNLYTAALFGGLYKLDARSPYDIFRSSSFTHVGYAQAALAHGNYIYVAFGPGGFITIDATDPQTPFVSDKKVMGYASDVKRYGDYLYVLDEAGELVVYDILIPDAPHEVASLSFSGSRLVGLEIKESLEGRPYLYTMKFNTSIVTIDLFRPDAPVVVWETDIHYIPGIDLEQTWNFLCVTTTDGFQLYDNLFFPAEPRWYNTFTVPGIIDDIASIDDICIVGTDNNGAHIVQLGHTVPLDTRLAHMTDYVQVTGIKVHENYAFMSVGNDGLAVMT